MDLDIKAHTNDTGNGEPPPKKPPTQKPDNVHTLDDTGNGEPPPKKPGGQ